jgi:hypothetical protein
MKKTLLTMLQLAVTIGLLWWVFHDPERRREMLGAKLADWRWLGAGVGVFFLCTIVATARWKILLAVQNIHMT